MIRLDTARVGGRFFPATRFNKRRPAEIHGDRFPARIRSC
jgi:hypothetical protein